MTFLAVTAVLFALTRIQLIVPDSTILSPEIFNRILTASSLTGIAFALPFVIGLIGYIVPLQIGARSVASRLNQFGYWLYTAGAFMIYASFLYTVPRPPSPIPPAARTTCSRRPTESMRGSAACSARDAGFVCFAINLVATPRYASAWPGLAPRSDLHGLRAIGTSSSSSARRCWRR